MLLVLNIEINKVNFTKEKKSYKDFIFKEPVGKKKNPLSYVSI